MNGLLIGRFQPFHLGHLEAILFGLSRVENLWIGIGSSNKSNEMKNPFTADERKEMIISSLDKKIAEKIKIYYIPDVSDHSKWTLEINSIVPKYDVVFSNDEFTQHLFQKRGVKIIPVTLKQRESLSGTNIRAKIANNQDWKDLVPEGTRNVLLKINAKDRLKVFNYK
ncbi:MAG TPA: nicotinamide-nucleotide adenylyltransferase [Nitrosopumilaceae archaeon]|nr:nicotinamide-nucleotide adenylyltransferase [Nitrosopumilaceae archaeon]